MTSLLSATACQVTLPRAWVCSLAAALPSVLFQGTSLRVSVGHACDVRWKEEIPARWGALWDVNFWVLAFHDTERKEREDI